MKQHIKLLVGISCFIAILSAGCKKSFFNRPPENALTVPTFYQTVAQVQASTNILYSSPWFGLNGKAFLAIGDLASGNAACFAGTDGAFDAFRDLTEGNATQEVQSAWDAEYTVIAQANELLGNLPVAVSNVVPATVVNNALGEAHLMRGVAYFYLVRQYGNVPIITDPTTEIGAFTTVPTNPVTDVYKFIVNDMLFAIQNCTPGVAHTGHASSNSAAGMLAKVYLYEQNYDSARYFAEEAINSGEFGLVGIDAPGTYTSMFELSGNNCAESMIAEQWTYAAGYGFGNQIQSVIAANSTITGTGDGYGELGPSWDLQDAFVAEGDTATYPNISGRRHGIIMVPGDTYPELQIAEGGYVVPATIDAQGMQAALKKYVVGDPADNGGEAAKQATSNNTYLLRYADVYLIEAEAILGQASGVAQGTGIPMTATSSDPTALKYLNLIRKRAGVVPAWTSFTYQQLLNERRLEFAIEGDYYYDLCRIDGFNNQTHTVAISIISAQDRGASSADPGPRVPFSFTPTANQFLLPVPSTESTVDPALLAPPVPYIF